MPFLIRQGQLVWIALVIGAAVLVLAVMIRTTVRQRRNHPDPGLYVRRRVAWMPLAAGLGALAMFLGLRGIGLLALKRAGDSPFAGRESDTIAPLHAVAIAAATPINRDDALDIVDRAGFEREQTCATRLAHGRIDELMEHLDECRHAPVWAAYARFVEGQPCEAADALAPLLWLSPDQFELALAFVTQASCRRWADAAVTAMRLEVGDRDAQQQWRCVGMIARRNADPTFAVPPDACIQARLEAATGEARAALVGTWASRHLYLFNLNVHSRSPGDDIRLTQAITLQTMALAPIQYSWVRTLEGIGRPDANDLLDPLGSFASGAGLGHPSMMTAFAANVVAAEDDLRVVPKSDLLASAAIGDVIAGDFVRVQIFCDGRKLIDSAGLVSERLSGSRASG